jgi:hypothetical protein
LSTSSVTPFSAGREVPGYDFDTASNRIMTFTP